VSREFERSSRLGERIRRVLADLIRKDLDDRRVALVSITAVEVARDLAHAKVYYSFLGSDEQREVVHEALVGAAGHLRSGLAKSLVSRTVPALEFVYDDSIARGARLDQLIAAARARDDESHRDDDD
jgi:ribosome-binding factor A